MKNISFALTTAQVRARTKTVTRRLGWRTLKVGDRLQACEKCMGRKPGEPLVRLVVIEVEQVWREQLRRLVIAADWGRRECSREGFPEMTPEEFVAFFCESHKKCTPETEITRIQFRYLE